MGGGPRKCPVQSCDFRSSKGFYNIPEHPVRRQAWVEACKLVLPYNKPICYRHFNMSDFLKEITDEDIAQLKFGSLKKNVVPSQNLPDDSEINLEPNIKEKSSNKLLIARICPVESCDYRSTKGYYAVPEDLERRQAWIEACKLSPQCNLNTKICFQHFKISDFMKEITDEDIAQLKFGSLKKNVVPSQNLPDDSKINLGPNVKVKSSNKSKIARICPIESCDYRSSKGFYAIPEYPERRQAWIEACKLSPKCNLYTRICFQHFRISDFMKDITKEDIAQCRFGKLNKDVVPSQNLPGDPKTDFAFFLEPNVILEESDEILKIKSEPCELNISKVIEGEIPSNQKLDENNWRDKMIKVEPSENDIISVGTTSNDFQIKGLKRGPVDPSDWRVESKPSKIENCEIGDNDEKRKMKQVYEQHGGYVIVNQESNGKRQRNFHDCTFYGFPHQSLHENYTYKNCKFYLE